MTKQSELAVQIRWLIRRDMPEVLGIERESFDDAWSEEDFLSALRERNCIGMVAEHNERIVGFMLYELEKAALHVLNFAVCPSMKRRHIGTQMVERLKAKLQQQKRTSIHLCVREGNLSAQLFYKRCGFVARKVLPCYYRDGSDAYVMQYRKQSTASQRQPTNRIAGFFND